MKGLMLFLVFLMCSGFSATRIASSGSAPDIVVDKDGNLHCVYMVSGTYKYCKVLKNGSIGSVIDVGFGVDQGDATRSHGEIIVDSDNRPHIFTGPGYAYLPSGSNSMSKISLGKRDNSIAIDKNDKILIVFRGSNGGEYSGPGMIQGRIKSTPEGSFGSTFNIDQNILARNNHVYGAVMAGPDNKFHLIFRHGPDNSIYYMQSSDGQTWGTGEKVAGANGGEGPRIVVTTQNRIVMCDMVGNTRQRVSSGNWGSLSRPVNGTDRKPPALAADIQGNVYITSNGGQVSILKHDSYTWIQKFILPNVRTGGYTHPATGADNGTYVIYEGTDGIYVAWVDVNGNIGDIGTSVERETDYSKGPAYDINIWSNPFALIRVYDIYGRLICKTNSIPSGVYILRTDIGKRSYVKRVILKK